MLSEDIAGWPETIRYSMAPFGYSVEAKKLYQGDMAIAYICRDCRHAVRVDPRVATVQEMSQRMRQHMDLAH